MPPGLAVVHDATYYQELPGVHIASIIIILLFSLWHDGIGYLVSWLEEIHRKLSWSHSRALLFEECPRKYYWRYYAPYGGNAPWETGNRETLYLLGRLTNVPMLVGTIVHSLARDALRSARDGHQWAEGTYSASAQALLKKALNASRKAAGRPPRGEGQDTAVLEAHHYGQPFGPHELEAAMERAAFYGRKLYEHPAFRKALENPADLLAIDRFGRFTLLEVPVLAVPDLVQQEQGGLLRVIDWKTGNSVAGRLDTYARQLAGYALYVRHQWGAEAQQITCEVAVLQDGSTVSVPVTEETLRQTEGRIAASILEMQSRLRDLEKNQAHRDDFPMRPGSSASRGGVPAVCQWCSYKSACYPQ